MFEILRERSIFPHEEIRVGFIGSSSVGKTEAFNQVVEITGIDAIPEIIRLATMAMNCPDVASVENKTLLQWTILRNQLHYESKKDTFLSDRTTLDNAAYWLLYHWKNGKNKGKVSATENDAYLKLARDNVQRYTHLIYFPILWEEVNDGIRVYDPEGRRQIDAVVRELIETWGVRHKTYQVTADNQVDGPDARLKEILEFLGLWPLMRARGLL